MVFGLLALDSSSGRVVVWPCLSISSVSTTCSPNEASESDGGRFCVLIGGGFCEGRAQVKSSVGAGGVKSGVGAN
ncbi:hypothetical protein JG687_00004713 [Phytophthora cactorum]|uniref:Uncharacterized protein n=1 Tax=Phytophthora cactorum TaxID=29920 RepID=A0A329SPQ3_9STRA|nr:hypothetical protein Pcac1_g23907 [Phytophthora cactorum]KAG2867111.1 hypothetical protein PC113_g2266 [Phytophthora cactorum]KAG2933476.1 hypothetical protein PC114_g1432 [Phytophthora cactorum]KAG2952868.1 hypothetical protein PC117_g2465 [Phytophthora cactorum]KAG3039961.1 hypothetical protein PC119_g1741 [Phytophthora cactorum]